MLFAGIEKQARAEVGIPTGSNTCNTCGKTYKHSDGLRVHLKWYCGQEPQFGCSMCPKKFYQKVHVKSHMLHAHRNLFL